MTNDETSLPDLLASMREVGDGFATDVPPDWLQGRTAYGGWSAAVALAAALRRWDDLPPLRSAQIAFVGPLGGAVDARPVLLRRGRNAAFVSVDIGSDAGLGLRATFVFMRAQDSHVELPGPRISPPGRGQPFAATPATVAFARNFELLATNEAPAGRAALSRWARLRARDGLHPMVELLAIGDVLPPAAMTLFQKMGPISSLTWQLNLLVETPSTEEGWWLVRASAETALDGASSQTMGVWNSDGVQVAAATQSVAIFV